MYLKDSEAYTFILCYAGIIYLQLIITQLGYCKESHTRKEALQKMKVDGDWDPFIFAHSCLRYASYIDLICLFYLWVARLL